MTNLELKRMVRNYYDKLEYIHPRINSDAFIRNSYEKWACKEIMASIDDEENLPFRLTPIELLTSFVGNMQNYACKNPNTSLMFVIAAETAEYFIEEYWRHH